MTSAVSKWASRMQFSPPQRSNRHSLAELKSIVSSSEAQKRLRAGTAVRRQIGVSITTGTTALTLIPRGESSPPREPHIPPPPRFASCVGGRLASTDRRSHSNHLTKQICDE